MQFAKFPCRGRVTGPPTGSNMKKKSQTPTKKKVKKKKKGVFSFANFSALLGEKIAIRKVGGEYLLVNRSAPSKPKPSKMQKGQRTRFNAAVEYARRQVADPVSRELYASRITAKLNNPNLVAIKDFMNPPSVRQIDAGNYRGRAGNTITIDAVDDFMVTRVDVTITSASGTIIEEGQATRHDHNHMMWLYTATVDIPILTGVKIKAVARDRPENLGSLEITL